MYLIRVELDRFSPEVRAALADCEKMHRLVMRLFGTQREESSVLYRTMVQGDKIRLYLYAAKPVSEVLASTYPVTQRDISAWLEAMQPGQCLSFDLMAAPSKKVAVPGKKNSCRRMLRLPEERLAWLERQAQNHGFRLLDVTEQEQLHQFGSHRQESGGAMYIDGYHYQGILQITDPEQFRSGISGGIGSGKAYGLGMLLVKNV